MIIAFALVLPLAYVVSAEAPLPSQPLGWPESAASRVQVLEQTLAAREAEIVGLRADVAVCQATAEQAKREYQSLVLTDDVAKAIERLKATQPGTEWTWDNERRRIVPVTKEQPK